MRAPGEKSEQKIFRAAVKLFDINGYHGTTLREIAREAGVNVALISYYFKNKKGLLEYLMIRYFEPLFEQMEQESRNTDLPVEEQLTRMLLILIRYQSRHTQITRIIQRELSVESILAREIMSVYLTRQKHFFVSVLERSVEAGHLRNLDIELTVMTLLSIVHYPYLNAQWVREVFYLEPMSDQFAAQFSTYLKEMVLSLIKKNEEK
ncbi:MAG: forespore capture DNA-binding protein RefZ [Bacillaceae bacterium]|nr:forespore capture DNA-binding protein RefZ [Bacillaceae bacterium]